MSGYDAITLLRVATMLGFVAVFVGVIIWQLMPGAGRRTADQAMIPLRDDDPPPPGPREHRR